ncbi:hypothetical protein CQW23_05312, partial [Capsicum baccatum]
IARGSGWQILGAYVNLGAFYLVGIPVAAVLCFYVNLKAKGLWIGLLVGTAIQATSLSFILGFADWQKQAIKAKQRLSEKSTRVLNEFRSGNPQKAQVAVKVAIFLAVASTVTFLRRGVLGKAYSNNQQGVDYVSAITPFLYQSSQISRGSGCQSIGAYVNE